jgi:predicted dehydrogenase
MAMKKIKIGIIGCDGIANQKHLPALANLKDEVEIVYFCDIIEDRAAKEYGKANAKIGTDYTDLVKTDGIDAVYVLTPNVNHSPITVAALEQGKHVMCEKPMAINYAEGGKDA